MYITDRISMKKLNSPVKIGLDFKTNTKKKKNPAIFRSQDKHLKHLDKDLKSKDRKSLFTIQ